MYSGNVKAVAIYQTQSGRRGSCDGKRCGEQFPETCGTAFLELRMPEETVIPVFKLLLSETPALSGSE